MSRYTKWMYRIICWIVAIPTLILFLPFTMLFYLVYCSYVLGYHKDESNAVDMLNAFQWSSRFVTVRAKNPAEAGMVDKSKWEESCRRAKGGV